MTIFSDRDIERLVTDKELIFSPDIDIETQIQPASVDLRLDHGFWVVNKKAGLAFDLTNLEGAGIKEAFVLYKDRDRFDLRPGEYVMAQTLEHVWMPVNVAARVEGKSSLARMGLTIHNTAPHINPGWDGHIALEIANQGPLQVTLVAEMNVCQLILHSMSSIPKTPYKGRHGKQSSPTG